MTDIITKLVSGYLHSRIDELLGLWAHQRGVRHHLQQLEPSRTYLDIYSANTREITPGRLRPAPRGRNSTDKTNSRRLIVAPKAEDRASDSGDVRIGKADMAGTCVK
ncbi:MAG TPA: hypothetical protein VFJ59_08070 [Pseudolabrys sp.]|nr:hypothetical protein [Pseudolabrys sp.]